MHIDVTMMANGAQHAVEQQRSRRSVVFQVGLVNLSSGSLIVTGERPESLRTPASHDGKILKTRNCAYGELGSYTCREG